MVSMGDSEREMKILEPDPKTFHRDNIILGDDADNMHEQMSKRSLENIHWSLIWGKIEVVVRYRSLDTWIYLGRLYPPRFYLPG